MKPIPTLSADLIRELDADEGKLEIKPNDDVKAIMWKAGRRSLIDLLKYRLEKTEESNNVFKS